MARNVCQCPNPPGGQVSCGTNQLAICRIYNGQIQSECVDPPEDMNDGALSAWMMQTIMQSENIERVPLDIEMLLTGRYVGKGEVTFSIPDQLMERAGLLLQRRT